MANVNDAKETAREAFTRLRTRVEPRLATLQDRIAPHLPDRVGLQLGAGAGGRRGTASSSGSGGGAGERGVEEERVHIVPTPPNLNGKRDEKKTERERSRAGSYGAREAAREKEEEKRATPRSSFSTSYGDDDEDMRRDKDDRAPLLPLRPITRASALSWSPSLHALASRILYRSGQCPISSGPLLVLNAAAFPDATEIDYNKLLPYVLANLPSDEELEGAEGYSVVMFAGGGSAAVGSGGTVAGRPSWAWTLQAYHLLGRAVRKKIRRLWVVHEKAWVRVLFEMMTGVVSSKFRKKVVHVATLTELAKQLEIQQLLIPPSAYLHNRKLEPSIVLPTFPPPPVFGRPPFPVPRFGDPTPLPDVLVDATAYLRTSPSITTEGLFRVPASQTYLDILKDAYDRRQAVRWDDWGPHSAAGLIKLYYRMLPTAVIPVDFYDQLPTGESEEQDKAQVQKLLKEVLPLESRVLLLRHLVPLLALIADNERENKMNARNLAICVAGSLARSEDVMRDVAAGEGVRRLVETAILGLEDLKPKLPARREAVGRKPVPAPVETGVPVDAVKKAKDSPRRKPVPTTPPLDTTATLTKVETNPERKLDNKAEEPMRRPSLPVGASPTVIISPSNPGPSTEQSAPELPQRRATLIPPAQPPPLRRKASVPALPTIPALQPDPANPGTFMRPQLRRVASANLDSKKREDRRGSFPSIEGLRPVGLQRSSTTSGVGLGSLPESGSDGGAIAAGVGAAEPGRSIRRVRSAGVRELSLLYEERARSAKVLEGLKKST